MQSQTQRPRFVTPFLICVLFPFVALITPPNAAQAWPSHGGHGHGQDENTDYSAYAKSIDIDTYAETNDANTDVVNVTILNAAASYVPTFKKAINLGAAPHGVAVTPDGKRIYVTDFSDKRVSVIDAASLSIVQNIVVGVGAVNIVIDHLGQRAYVTNEGEGTLSVITLSNNTVIKTIPLLTRLHGMALAPDPTSLEVDQRLYVCNLGSNKMSVIDTQTLSVIGTVAVGDTPDSPLATQDGSSVWVTNYGDGTISRVSATSLTQVLTLTVGDKPHGIRFAPADEWLYVSVETENEIAVIDPLLEDVGGSFATGTKPHGLNITPDGRYLWTGNLIERSSSIIDTYTGEQTASISTGALSMPHAIAFSPDGYHAYITDFSGRRLLVYDVRRPAVTIPLAIR